MAGDGDGDFLLRGGGRDGEVTTVLPEVTRLYVGQETAEGLAPELQHMQGPNPVPGDS